MWRSLHYLMVLLCAPYFNTITAAVDVICARNSQKVMLIGAKIMGICVSVFVSYVKLYCY